MAEHLADFDELESCPDCGCLTILGTLRCPECGLFHQSLADIPEPESPPEPMPVEQQEIDTSLYSLNPRAPLAAAEEDEDLEDPTIDWDHSSTDFTFDDRVDDSISQGDSEGRRGGDDDE